MQTNAPKSFDIVIRKHKKCKRKCRYPRRREHIFVSYNFSDMLNLADLCKYFERFAIRVAGNLGEFRIIIINQSICIFRTAALLIISLPPPGYPRTLFTYLRTNSPGVRSEEINKRVINLARVRARTTEIPPARIARYIYYCGTVENETTRKKYAIERPGQFRTRRKYISIRVKK